MVVFFLAKCSREEGEWRIVERDGPLMADSSDEANELARQTARAADAEDKSRNTAWTIVGDGFDPDNGWAVFGDGQTAVARWISLGTAEGQPVELLISSIEPSS